MGVRAGAIASPVGPTEGPRVLVIDPNPDHQVLTVTALVPRGFRVTTVSTGREGIARAAECRFEAFLVDAKLRDPPVLDVLRLLSERFPDAPRIVLVPVDREGLARKGLESGATSFVVKSPSYRVVLPAVVSRLIQDVQTRQRTDQALRESQRVLSTLMSNLPGMAYRCRNDPPRWTDEFVSDGAEALTGYPPDAFARGEVVYSQLIHPDDLGSVLRTIEEAVRAKEPFQALYRIRTAAGQEKWVWEQGRAIYTPAGEVRALEGFVTDIAERKVAQEHVARSERMFRAMFEDAADGILRIDAGGYLLAINPAGAESLGRSPADIVGHPLEEFLPRDETPRVMKYLETLLSGSSAPEVVEVSMVSPRGGRRAVEIRGRVVRPEGRAPYVEAIARDITERRDLLRKVSEAERLAAFGRLALYVAHEVNTPLQNIALLTESAEQRATDPGLRAKLEKIHAERRRAAAIISELLNFSRPQRVEGIPTDVRVLVQAAVEHVEPSRHPGVSLFADLGAEPVLSRVNPVQIESVLVHLLNNALEATARGSVSVRLDTSADRVTIRVADTGVGMSQDILSRLFEAFFTTKPRGYGVGMGLASAKKIVEGHGGTIDVMSRPGEGTTVTVTLPHAREALPAVPLGPQTEGALPEDREARGRAVSN